MTARPAGGSAGTTMPPRAVIVHRRSELTELIERHGTRGQAAFFLQGRGQQLAGFEARHHQVTGALAVVSAAVPADWRRASLERAELPRFSFEPGDVVVVVGQDGLVANVARYLDRQPVIGIDPEPGRNPGVLVRHDPGRAGKLLAAAVRPSGPDCDELAMVTAGTDDGQQLTALNEVFLGHASHQTARYELTLPGGRSEQQASSGVIAGTGTGATGWCRSVWQERRSTLALPAPAEPRLAWFVREAWPSPVTGTGCTEGELRAGEALTLTAASDQLVLFGDGMEADAVTVSAGQRVRIALAPRTLHLVR